MAESMKNAVISGRKAFKAGRMKKRLYGGNPSSPTDNLI
jgi:thiazole synthase ThiGH ThiG subunit